MDRVVWTWSRGLTKSSPWVPMPVTLSVSTIPMPRHFHEKEKLSQKSGPKIVSKILKDTFSALQEAPNSNGQRSSVWVRISIWGKYIAPPVADNPRIPHFSCRDSVRVSAVWCDNDLARPPHRCCCYHTSAIILLLSGHCGRGLSELASISQPSEREEGGSPQLIEARWRSDLGRKNCQVTEILWENKKHQPKTNGDLV